MDYFRKYLGPSQGDLQPTGADTVSIINERMSSVINAWETGVYFHFNPIQIKYNNTGTLVSAFFFQYHDTVQSSNWVLSQLILEMDNKNLLPTLNTCLPSVQPRAIFNLVRIVVGLTTTIQLHQASTLTYFLTCPFGQLTKKSTCPTQSFSCPKK